MTKMNADERLVDKFLRSYGLLPNRFTDEDNTTWGGQPGNRLKLPDFKVSTSSGGFFYCEVKSLMPVAEDGATSFNIYGQNIYDATKQFAVVNKSHIVPNVLIWVNHRRNPPMLDLEMVYNGAATMTDGTVVGGFERLSKGKVKDKKWEVDLHIGLNIDRENETLSLDGEPSWFFTSNRPEFTEELRRIFGVNPSSIKTIPKLPSG